MTTWDYLARHAGDYHGTIGSAAAVDLGLAASTLAAWCEQGRLLRPAPQVYVVAGSPKSWSQGVAIAAASTDGWASHRTSATLWRFDGFGPRQIEVLVPHGRWRTRRDWIVHESRRLRGVDLDETEGIPCTSIARTILDLPAVVPPFKVGQALDYACRTWPDMLDVTVQRFLELGCRGRRGTRLLRAMLEERLRVRRFNQNDFEKMTTRLVRAVGLPGPVPQYHVQDGGDFSVYLDLAWPAILWAVECDSMAWHTGKRSHEWDRFRRRKLKQLGWDLVEVTYDDVTKRRRRTGEQLYELYHLRQQTFCPRSPTDLRTQRGQNGGGPTRSRRPPRR